jgi:hypothetical protein
MAHGWIHAYAPSYPQVAIQVLFVSLVVLDPLVVVLIVFVRREGIWLAAAVIVLDVAANWIGNWTGIRREWVSNVPWFITAYGMFIVATALPLLRVMKVPHCQVDGQTPADVV